MRRQRQGAGPVARCTAAGEPSPLAVLVGPAVVHAGRAHRDRPGPDRHLPGTALAVPDDQSVTVVIAFLAMRLQVRGDLGLQPAGEIAASGRAVRGAIRLVTPRAWQRCRARRACA
jgi:hypothetical protein